MTIKVACVGLAVNPLVPTDNIRGFVIDKRKNRTFIGVPFQGALPFDHITEALNQQVPELSSQVIGNFTFVADMHM